MAVSKKTTVKKAAKKPAAKKAAAKKPAAKKAPARKAVPRPKAAVAKKKAPVKRKPAAKKAKPAVVRAVPEDRGGVLVTGAAGFVGSHIVEEFLSSGFRVVATDFPGSYLAPMRNAGADTIEADITSAESIGAVFEGRNIRYVAHVAALYDLGAPRDKLMRVNRDGTSCVCMAAQANNVEHVMILSTGDVYGQPKNMPITEDFPANPISDYALSKYAGEKEARRLFMEGGPSVTVLRPGFVYGPRSRYVASVFYSIPGVMRSVEDRFHLDAHTLRAFSGGVSASWVHAADLARAVRFLMGKDAAFGEIFNVADDRPLSMEELFSMIVQPFGYEWKGVAPLSKYMMSRLASLAMSLPDSFFKRLTGFMQEEWEHVKESYDLSDDLQPKFDRDFLSFLLGDRVYDNSKLKSLGFSLKYPDPFEGFHESIQWYQKFKWLPRVEETIF